jgi:alkylation response protein AidB-like acyl-CoA dehydrogenase
VGEIGRGHKIALNILNLGRLKLGVGVLGGMKDAIQEAVKYGIQRKQFNTRLVDFPLIQQKFARMVTATYASESMGYRAAGQINDAILEAAEDESKTFEKHLAALEELSGECAINKAYDSECLDLVVDEALQIHGGYGFIEEYSIARGYRDARISRLYEGTNEINRLFITGNLFKRAMTGRLPLVAEVQKIQAAVLNPLETYEGNGQPLSDVAEAVFNAKRLFLFVSGVIAQKFMPNMEKISEEQEALAWMADMIMEIYALESAYLRARKRLAAGDQNAGAHEDVTRYQMAESTVAIEKSARELIDGFFTDDSRTTNQKIVKKFAKWPHVNKIEIGRRIAKTAVEKENYPFEVVG